MRRFLLTSVIAWLGILFGFSAGEDLLRRESLYPQAGAVGLSLQYPVFEEIKGEELRALKSRLDSLPLQETIVIDSQVGTERKRECWDVSFYPYIRKGHRYYRLESFEWAWQYGTPVGFAYAAPVPNYTGQSVPNDPSRYAAASKLAKGKWARVSVKENGIYKLTYSDLRNMGIDPEKAQVYGYGGYLQKEDFREAEYIDDLPEVPVWRNEKEKYILFYAKGPCEWIYDSTYKIYTRRMNHYSTKGCYLVGERAEGSQTASLQNKPTSLPGDTATRYTYFALHEKDLYNLGYTGRECFGEDFVSNTSQTFHFDIPDWCTDQSSKLLCEFAARCNIQTSCKLSINQELVGQMNFGAISADNSYTYATSGRICVSFNPSKNNPDINLQYVSNGQVSKCAHLNYIVINACCELKMHDSPLCFRVPSKVASGRQLCYRIGNANADTRVFDVTQDGQLLEMAGELKKGCYYFQSDASTLHEFVAVNTKGSIPRPTLEGKVENQNLHGYGPQDFVIITHPDFLEQAERLAEAHRRHDGTRCLVVTAQQIYNEFSSGTPDATAYRRFMKMFYDRADEVKDIPESLLLFGDGVYDNRLVTVNFSGNGNKPNKLLTYESAESLEGTASYVTDDYFGLLDDTEGGSLAAGKIDVGVGRFPVRTLQEARTAVDKAISYMENKDKGSWKNRLLFLGDDGDNNSHTNHADVLAETVKSNHPEFMVNKIFVDAYQRVTSTSGTTVPDANKRFDQLLSDGLLMLNYNGHGSTTAWATEGLLTIGTIKSMQNTRLPLWVTATCDFCRYDSHETSGGELVFLNADGGAIALITTSRIVYSGPNFVLNRAFINQVFNKTDGSQASLGELIRRTKQSSALQNDQNKLNFALIGDPALKLSYPLYTARITAIDGHQPDPERPDTLSALSTVELSGEILRPDGQLAEDFDGFICPTVFDIEEEARTLGAESNDVFIYKDRNKILYSGKASVENGRFSFRFIVPKDLSYRYGHGQINLYAYSSEQEAQGVFEDFLLGGTDNSLQNDTCGPAIRLFLNDTLFAEGGRCNRTPTLIAYVEDPNGLNASGNGIGHDFTLQIDGQEKYDLNAYFESDLNSCTSGIIRYQLPTLDPGIHRLSLKAWDMQNNSNSAQLGFEVVEDYRIHLSNLLFHQNAEKAWFTFDHDRPANWMTLEMRVCDLYGRTVWTSSTKSFSQDGSSPLLEWNYVGDNGLQVENGVYICRLTITLGDGQEAVTTQKIMIDSL